LAFRTGIAPSALLAEDPDMLSTLIRVIDFADREAERAAKRR